MTKIVFTRVNGILVRVECKGHTGYAESGSDVICSAVSALVQSTALGVLKVAKVAAKYVINEDKGVFVLDIPQNISDEAKHDVAVLMDTLLISLTDIQEGYSEFINVEVN